MLSIVWFLAFSFYSIMRQFGQDVVDEPGLEIGEFVLVYIIMGLAAGLVFGTVDTILPHNFSKRASFGNTVLLRSGLYFIIFILLICLGILGFSFFDKQELTFREQFSFLFSEEMILVLCYCFIVVFQINFVKEVDTKFGPGNLLKMLLGSFHKPKEEDRIFMFLDLKSSTTIAEKLGHLKYSQLIQDCFSDLKVISKYKAEIYQYVGDEAVMTWTLKNGLAESNCLGAFYRFKWCLQARSEYYQDSYGLVPQFKAGLNVGSVVVAEVGEEKREIAYHGDTINTAARIQSECGKQEEEILISNELCALLTPNDNYEFISKGEVQLKGKFQKTRIHAVREVTRDNEYHH